MNNHTTILLVILGLIGCTSGLHLHLQTVARYADNLDQSNENYYFGSIEKATYFSAQSRYRQDNPEVQSCPPSLPYVNTSSGNHSCLACQAIKQGINLNTAKVLFNLQSRQCEVCASGKTTICDKLLVGTYFTSAATTPTPTPTTTTTPTTTSTPTTTTTTTTPSTTSTPTTASATSTAPTTTPTANSASTTTITTNNTTTKTNGTTNPTENTTKATSNQASSSAANTVLSSNCPPQRPLYNEETKLCDSCSSGSEFLGTKQQCVPIIYATDPATKGLILTNLTELIDLNQALQKKYPQQVIQFCPSDKPYAQNNKCISCQGDDQYFYVTTNACVTGCPTGTYYDTRVRQCAPALFYSDVNAPWLVSQLGSYDKWKAKVQYQATSSPRMTKCPQFKPYQKNGQCISCQGGKYFDIDQNDCVACSRGREYNAEQRRCVGIINYDHSMKTFAAGVI